MKIQNNSLENIKQLNYSLLKNESVILVYSSLNGLFYCTEQFFQLFKEVSLDEDFSYEDLIDILPIKHQKYFLKKLMISEKMALCCVNLILLFMKIIVK